MPQQALSVDYLIKGAGAAGMAFADSVLTDSDATMAIVDRHDRPGGHWNNAYPFVRLHQPAATYGVNSLELGSGALDQTGLNTGFQELASGNEVVSHFDRVMQHRFIPSGRVTYVAMSELDSDDTTVRSLVSGARMEVEADCVVDATYSKMEIPSTTLPSYAVSSDSACVPVNALPREAPNYREFVVIGAGKTGMDACNWLLQNGAAPEAIRWIMPRDSWVLDRANVQASEESFAQLCKSLADQLEAVVRAESIDDVFVHLEQMGEFRRIDRSVTPETYHCAILSDQEIAALRRLPNVVRSGRVISIEPDRIELEEGSIPTGPDCLHVDCSAAGIPTRTSTPIFGEDRITLQWIRTCQPTFSAALIGYIESTFDEPDLKNQLCKPIAPPTVPRDWLTMLEVELENRATWSQYPQIDDWLAASRLDPFRKFALTRLGVDAEATEHLQRYLTHVGPAGEKLEELLAG